MGLDYSIEVRFHREKDNKVEQHEIEIAYWRKCWTLRTETMLIADWNESQVLERVDDFLIRTTPDVLPNVINSLLRQCKNRDSEWFSDSIWGAPVSRIITLKQLQRMAAWDSLFEALPDILEIDTTEGREDFLQGEISWIIDEIEQDGDFKLKHDEFIDILTHLDEGWEISLCFYNSY